MHGLCSHMMSRFSHLMTKTDVRRYICEFLSAIEMMYYTQHMVI